MLMTDNKRKKNSRQRGSWTHGWGAKKKHRGAGHRGGRGAAGSGKRGDAKKTMYWQDKNYFGERGFNPIQAVEDKTINVSHLNTIADTLIKNGKAKKDKDIIIIDLGTLGYTKLLGAGNVKRKFNITVDKASKSAEEKIKGVGGTLMINLQSKTE
jgi:large subunit ribosomal protein L15